MEVGDVATFIGRHGAEAITVSNLAASAGTIPYEILTGRVHPWSFESATNRYADVANTLRLAMTENQSLHVLVASGYYDLATPYFAAQFSASDGSSPM